MATQLIDLVVARCLWFDRQKGYGFLEVVPDSETVTKLPVPPPNIFVHQSDIQMTGFRHLRQNQRVQCAVGVAFDGRFKASQVQLATPADATASTASSGSIASTTNKETAP